ncbi:hypothetical protein ACFWA3_45030, partial [Streptomyces sp. NPDC059970]
LDHYQVRLYRAWYRHITLAMAAHAYLTAARATPEGAGPGDTRRREPMAVAGPKPTPVTPAG